MSRHFYVRLLRAIVFSTILLVSPLAIAGPGHDHGSGDHGHGPQETAAGPASPRLTAVSETYELVGILKDGKLTVYLDRLADTSPVRDAAIDLMIDGEAISAKPQPDGTYLAASPVLAKHGDKQVVVTIAQGGRSDILIGTLHDTHEHHDDPKFDHSHADHHPEIAEGADSPAGKMMRKLSQPQVLAGLGLGLGLLLGVLIQGRAGLVASLVVLAVVVGGGVAWAGPGHGHDHGGGAAAAGGNGDAPRRLPDGAVFLPKPTQRLLEIRTRILKPESTRSAQRLIGRVISDPNRSGLVQSTIGGRIKPPKGGLPVLGQAVKAGDILAYVEPAFAAIDASDVRQTAGDLEQQIALLNARISRQKRLVKKRVASRANLEDLEIQLEGVKARREQLTKSRSEPEVLVSPVDGVIAEIGIVAGQVVQSSDTLAHIVDPASLWVEAISFEPGLAVETSRARARTLNGEFFDLTFIGRSRALQQQSTVFQFRIDQPNETLSIGSPVKVLVESGRPVSGIILPRSAIAQAPNGQTVAFKRVEPERYKPAPVRLEDVDGERVHVIGGLKAGDQVIVRNAPLVNQIR